MPLESNILEDGAVQNSIVLDTPQKVDEDSITIPKVEYENLQRENKNLRIDCESLFSKYQRT